MTLQNAFVMQQTSWSQDYQIVYTVKNYIIEIFNADLKQIAGVDEITKYPHESNLLLMKCLKLLLENYHFDCIVGKKQERK